MRPTDVVSSGNPSVQARHSASTSAARSIGNQRMPAYTSRMGNSLNSIAVTTPKFPPPPRNAQNRSGSFSRSTRRRRPSAVTSSIAVT